MCVFSGECTTHNDLYDAYRTRPQECMVLRAQYMLAAMGEYQRRNPEGNRK